MKLRLALLLATAGALVVSTPALAAYPNSIASTGDSITRAFNDCWFPYVDCPSASWSTGTSSYSHYRRIQSVNYGITGRSYNHAVTGADMADLYGQVQGVIAGTMRGPAGPVAGHLWEVAAVVPLPAR